DRRHDIGAHHVGRSFVRRHPRARQATPAPMRGVVVKNRKENEMKAVNVLGSAAPAACMPVSDKCPLAFACSPRNAKVGQLRMNVKNFTQRMIALASWFENARYGPALYLFSTTRRVHGTLDAAPAIATGVVVGRILETEDCHFVTELRGYGAAG